MADTAEFFNTYLPNKIAEDESIKDIPGVFVFDIDGAGAWTLNCAEGTITEGNNGGDCTVSAAKDDWEKMLDNPALAMQLFGMGKLKVDNLQMGLQLQRILG